MARPGHPIRQAHRDLPSRSRRRNRHHDLAPPIGRARLKACPSNASPDQHCAEDRLSDRAGGAGLVPEEHGRGRARAALTVHGVVDLRGQRAAGTAGRVPGAGSRWASRPCPRAVARHFSGRRMLATCWWARVMVESTATRHPPVDQPIVPRAGEQDSEHTVPGPVGGPALVAVPHGLPARTWLGGLAEEHRGGTARRSPPQCGGDRPTACHDDRYWRAAEVGCGPTAGRMSRA